MSFTSDKKALASTGAVVALAAGALVASAPAASAAPIESCPEGRFCFFFNSGYAGARADYRYSDAGLRDELFSDRGGSGHNVVVNDNAASFVNNTGQNVYLFKDRNCEDPRALLVPPNSKTNLQTGSFNFKNQVSSVLTAGSECKVRDQTRW